MLVSLGDFAPDIRGLLTTGIRLLKIEEKQQQPFLAMLSLTVYTVKEVCFIMVINVRFTLVWVRPSGSTRSPATLLGTCSQKQVPNELVSIFLLRPFFVNPRNGSTWKSLKSLKSPFSMLILIFSRSSCCHVMLPSNSMFSPNTVVGGCVPSNRTVEHRWIGLWSNQGQGVGVDGGYSEKVWWKEHISTQLSLIHNEVYTPAWVLT